MRILASPAAALRSLNPYCFLLYSHLQAEVVEYSWWAAIAGSYKVFHLHWPETELNTLGPVRAYLQLKKKLFLINYLRLRGTRILWTIHNLQSHERRYTRMENWFWNRFTQRLDGVFVLNESALEPALTAFPHLSGLPVFVTPHGHYRGEYPADLSREEARKKLGIAPDAKLLLSFGQIRPYKNVDLTLAAFRALPGADLVLLIVGECRDADLLARLVVLAGGDPRIRFVPQHIAAADVQMYLSAADLVVLPYRDILNSGSALLALSFDRPVLVSDRGAMQDLQRGVGEQWVHVFSGALTSAVLEEAVRWAIGADREKVAPLDAFDWSNIADQTLRAFHQMAAEPRRR